MPNIYGLLNIGQSALLAQQKAIDITGNNIANVNTEGYSRQRLTLEQSKPVRVDGTTMSTRCGGQCEHSSASATVSSTPKSVPKPKAWDVGKPRKAPWEKIELMFDETSGYGLSEAMSNSGMPGKTSPTIPRDQRNASNCFRRPST